MYRTMDGSAYFEFRFVNIGTHYEVDVISMPNIVPLTSKILAATRIPSERGGSQIYLEYTATTYEDARKYVSVWAEKVWTLMKDVQQTSSNNEA